MVKSKKWVIRFAILLFVYLLCNLICRNGNFYKRNLKSSTLIDTLNNVRCDIYRPFNFGVAGEIRSYYLVINNSTSKYIGRCDEKEYYRITSNSTDSIQIIKLSRRNRAGKEPLVLEKYRLSSKIITNH